MEMGTDNRKVLYAVLGVCICAAYCVFISFLAVPAFKIARRPVVQPAVATIAPTAISEPDVQDPTLRLDLVAKMREATAAGESRNLRPAAPSLVPARPTKHSRTLEDEGPRLPLLPADPEPPSQKPAEPVDVKYYGWASASGSDHKSALLLDGDDVVVKAEGEIVKGHYRVAHIGPDAVVLEDTNDKLLAMTQVPLVTAASEPAIDGAPAIPVQNAVITASAAAPVEPARTPPITTASADSGPAVYSTDHGRTWLPIPQDPTSNGGNSGAAMAGSVTPLLTASLDPAATAVRTPADIAPLRATGGAATAPVATLSSNIASATPAVLTTAEAISPERSSIAATADLNRATAAVSDAGIVVTEIAGAAPAPAIREGGVVNGASFGGPLARGALATIFGSNLAETTASAESLPLPTTLGGAQVTVDGVAAPLVFASPTQINFQVPFEAPIAGVVPVVVRVNGTPSASEFANIAEYAPGVFTYAVSANALAPVIVHSSDNTLVTATKPASPNELLVIYGTGVGRFDHAPATGAAAAASPLASSTLTPEVTVGGAPAHVFFAGLTPGAVGLLQINIQLPPQLPAGNSLPLSVQFGSAASQIVNLDVGPAAPASLTAAIPPNPQP
jgi:uncharacterized protein (TIGR03437 family)